MATINSINNTSGTLIVTSETPDGSSIFGGSSNSVAQSIVLTANDSLTGVNGDRVFLEANKHSSSNFIELNYNSGGSTITIGNVTSSNDQIIFQNNLSNVMTIGDGAGNPGGVSFLGIITAGTWQGNPITGTYGGTGVNNGTSTITIGGNVAFSGASTFTGTLTGNTSVTFPTSGTLATTATTVSSVSGTANRITSTGGTTPVIDISAAYVGQNSITTLGTISSGTWQGAVVGGTYGGTGVNNGASTITIGGNVTFSGASAFTGTLTGNTSVTFPTSGTLSTTTGTVTSITQGTNMSFSTSPITTTGTINLASTVSGLTSLSTAALTAAGTVNINSTGSGGTTIGAGGGGVTIGKALTYTNITGRIAMLDNFILEYSAVDTTSGLGSGQTFFQLDTSTTQSYNPSIERWGIGIDTNESMSGNSGSNFNIWRYSDTGTFLTSALNINRSTGTVTIAGLTAAGPVNINVSGSNSTTIGTGGTGAVDIGNATGNTSVTGTLTATGNIKSPNFLSGSINIGVFTEVTNFNQWPIQSAPPGFAPNTVNSNTAFGVGALNALTTGGGGSNSAFGANALTALTTGSNNLAFGAGALESCTSSSQNCVLGCGAAGGSITAGGGNNTVFGYGAYNQGTAPNNIAFGLAAMSGSTTGSPNICVGNNSGTALTSGANNVFIGDGAGAYAAIPYNIITGTENIMIGSNASSNSTSAINRIGIGYLALATFDNTIQIGGVNMDLCHSTGALATNATIGFTRLPTCAGSPTGTPNSLNSTAAFVYDSTNNLMNIYNGSWHQFGPGSGTVTSITAGTGLSGGTISTSGTIAIANTAVTAGSYTLSDITVNAQGQITAASNGSPPPTPQFQQSVLTTSGTFTTPVGTSTSTVYKITMIGGGGGGQGNSLGGQNYGGGGGAGGTVIFWGSGVASGVIVTVTVGTGGAGSAFTVGSGNGTDTTMSFGSTVLTAGFGSGTISNIGGAGGTASNGTINIPGQHGMDAIIQTSGAISDAGGSGGSTMYGGGGPATYGLGYVGTGYGAGGSGSGGNNGGNGSGGIVIFEWIQ